MSDAPHIRKATRVDGAAVAAVLNPIIAGTTINFSAIEKSPDEMAELIETRWREGFGFWVAEFQGKVQGYGTYAQFRGGDGYARTAEHTIMLADAARGQGLGRALITRIEAHARDRGFHTIFAGVSGENAAGIEFHRAMGYENTWVIPEAGWKFERWVDLVLMQKFL